LDIDASATKLFEGNPAVALLMFDQGKLVYGKCSMNPNLVGMF